MKIAIKIDTNTISIPEEATVLDLILATHKECKNKKLPFPTYYFMDFPRGYARIFPLYQYQLVSQLQEFKEFSSNGICLTIYTSEKFRAPFGWAQGTSSLAILSLHVLRQKMHKIINTMLCREIYSTDAEKNLGSKKIVAVVPKTLQMLKTLKEYNLEEKDMDNQLISDNEIILFEEYITNTSIQSFIHHHNSNLYGKLVGADDNYQLEENTDLKFDLPVDDRYMFDLKKQKEFNKAPKFLSDLREILIKIKVKEITFKKNSLLKVFEFCFNEIVKQLKKNKIIDIAILANVDRLKCKMVCNTPLLEHLLESKDFCNYLKVTYKLDLNFLINNNLVNNLKLFKKYLGWTVTNDHLKTAIRNHAMDSLTYLLEECKPSSQQKLALAKQAIASGNLSIIKLLYPEQPLFYFLEIINEIHAAAADILSEASISLSCMEKDKIFLLVSQAYRFSSIGLVEQICTDFVEYLETYFSAKQYNFIIKQFKEEIILAHNEFKKWGNQIAWYYSTEAADDLCAYGPLVNMYNIKSEIDFGGRNFGLVTQLSDHKFTKPSSFTNNLSLPICPPPNKFYSMSDLLQIMSEARSELAKYREPGHESFRERRPSPCPGTSCGGRYKYMEPLIETMTTCNNNASLNVSSEGYELLYKGEVLSVVKINQEDGCWIWEHGATTKEIIEKFWPDVEKLHKKLFDIDSQQILKNPQMFYQDVIEVLWLMGNLQIMTRGTGRYVEQWFALVHRIHDLPIPKLKLGQLDCYNITFSLPIYKKIFLYFFDIKSLHPLVLADMKKQYVSDPETRDLVKKFNLEVPADFTAAIRDDKVVTQEKISEFYPQCKDKEDQTKTRMSFWGTKPELGLEQVESLKTANQLSKGT